MSTAISTWRTKVRRDVAQCPNFEIDDAVLEILRDFCSHTRCWVKQLTQIELEAYQPNYSLTSADGEIVIVTHVEVDGSTLTATSEKDLDLTEYNWRNQTATVPARYYMDSDRVLRAVYTPNEDSDAYFTLSDLTFTAPDTIASTAGGFVTNGLTAGQTLTVSGSTSNNRDFVIESVSETSVTAEGGVTSEGSGAASATFGVGVLNVWVALQPLRTATTVEDFLYNDYFETIADGARGILFGIPGKPWSNGELMQYYTAKYRQARSKAWHEKRYGRTTAVSLGVRG